MWGFFVSSMILILGAILLLLRRYCAHSVTFTVKVATAYAWLTAMAVVAIVPLDVYSTLNYHKPSELGVMWDVAFWSTQALTWLILPFFQYYADAGDFTVKNKSLTSLKENAILYGSVAAVGVIGIAALLISKKMTMDSLMGVGIGLSNAFGLIASIILLGYGLVEIPRNMWKADPERQLKWCAHRAGKYAEKVMKATAELETVVTIIAANERQIRRHDPLRKYMDIIVDNLEKESPIKPSDLAARAAAAGRPGIDIESIAAEDLEYNYDVAGLAALRRRMFFAISTYNGDRAQYEEVMAEAFELEDIVKCRQLNDYTPRVPTRSPIKKAVWYYKCALRAHWHRVLAVVFAMLSVLIVWAEATIVSPADISPLSLLIKGTDNAEFGVQLLTLLPLAYICACTYAALFSITAFDYNKLIPRATIGSALMQNGTLMCRFAAPTCWNFYHMIRMTGSHDTTGTTVFEDKMGSMDVPAFLRQHLNTYLPLILVVECAITLLNLWDRIMGICVSSKYKFSNDDDVEDAYTEKGRQLIAREREAVGKGFAVGQVLTTAFFDLDFPDIVGGPRSRTTQQKKGIFGFFKKSAPAPAPVPPPQRSATMPSAGAAGSSGAAQPPAATRYQSATAAAAAARWLGRGTGVPAGGDGGAAAAAAAGGPSLLDGGATTSLLAARYDKSPTPEYDTHVGGGGGGGGGKSGLDGIFADLNVAGGGGAGGAGAGGAGRGGAAAGATEKDSLLGGFWGRS